MPAPALSLTSTTQVSAVIGVANVAADGTLDVQYSLRPDFRLGVSPLVLGVARADFTLTGLNRGTTHYVRARSRRASGAIEDWSNVLGVRTAAGAARVTAPAAVMISPAIIVVPAPILNFQNVSTTVAGYPVENLAYDGPVAWVSKPAASDLHAFTVDLGGEDIDTIALLSSNAHPDATVTIKAGPTAAVAAYTLGPVNFRASAELPGRPGYHALIRLPAVRSDRYWRVEVTSINFSRQFHLEHAVFGKNRVTKNHSVEKAEASADLGTLERTRAGNPIRTLGARMRRVDFDISMLTEAQFEQNYADLDWRVGQTEPVLCVPNSKDNAFLHDRILYGAIRGGRTVNPASPYYTRGFTIESLI
jgi:hypothetical protein